MVIILLTEFIFAFEGMFLYVKYTYCFGFYVIEFFGLVNT